MPNVVMPRLAESMEEGTILRWLKSAGDAVARGDELVEIETDKATMTYEAEADGVLRVVAGEGDTLPVGGVIATLGETGAADDGRGRSPRETGDEGGGADAPAASAPAARSAGATTRDGREKASPVARRLARERGVDLSAVKGTGP